MCIWKVAILLRMGCHLAFAGQTVFAAIRNDSIELGKLCFSFV